MQPIERWEIYVFLGAVFFMGMYLYNHVDFEDLFRPQAPTPMHMSGKVQKSTPLKNVEVVDIPAAVYASFEQDASGSKYLQGNEKYILMISTDSCPYARAFKNAFKTLFKEGGYKEFYRKHIFEVGRSYVITCSTENCAKMWIFSHCGGGFCIVNPKLKKAVIDNSQDAAQIARTLEKYKEW